MKEKEQALCSVIIPIYNCEMFLERTLKSVLSQTWSSLEIILIEDGSTDQSKSIAGKYANRYDHIFLFINSKNQGVAYSRNQGVQLAQGKYIAFLDSDDLWMPEKISAQIEFMERQKCDVCCSSYHLIQDSGEQMSVHYIQEKRISFNEMLKQNLIGLSSVLMKASVAKLHPMPESFFHEDYAYWMTLLRKDYVIVGMKAVLMCYRVHKKGKSANKIVAAKGRWEIYRRLLALTWPQTIYYFIYYFLYGVKKHFICKNASGGN